MSTRVGGKRQGSTDRGSIRRRADKRRKLSGRNSHCRRLRLAITFPRYFSPASTGHLQDVLLRSDRAGGEIGDRTGRVIGLVEVERKRGVILRLLLDGQKACRTVCGCPAVSSGTRRTDQVPLRDRVELIGFAIQFELRKTGTGLVRDLIKDIDDADRLVRLDRARTSLRPCTSRRPDTRPGP